MEECVETKSKFVDAKIKQTDSGYSCIPNILIDNVTYINLGSYLSNLRKSGLDEIKAIRFIIQKKGIEVVGLFKNNGNKRNQVYLGKLSIDDEGYPAGIRLNKEARKSYISLQRALAQQGNPKEIFINFSKYYYFCTAKRTCSINSFLNYTNLNPSQIRVISYTGMANPCRIEIMKRGKQFNSGKLLETLDVDSQGCPIGLSKGKQKFSLLELLVQQGKIDCKQLFKNKVLKDSQLGFYLRGITYNCVGAYKSYQEEFGIGKVTELEIKENESSIDIMGRTKNSKGREKKVLNRMHLDKDRKPLLIPSPNQKSLSLLKILFLQNQIDPEGYHTFKDKHRYKARAKYKTEQEIITALVERTKHQGGKANNTAFALRKYCREGGDASLYYACRKWDINLPKKCRINLPKKKYTPWIEPIISYLADIYSSNKPTEEEACYLMQRAMKGDKSAFAELTLRLRPIVIQVIEEDLHIDTQRRDHKGNLTKSELIDELIAEGNLIILTRMKEVDYKGRPINSLRNILIEELQEVKRLYYIQRHDWQSSLDEILPRKHSRNTTRKEELISREYTPLESLVLQEIKSGLLKRKKI